LNNWKARRAFASLFLQAGGRRSARAATSRAWSRRRKCRAKSKAEAGRFAALLYCMHTYPKPLVARVHGAAFAGGMGLVAACDLVVAAEEAEFCLPEVRIGLVPAMISPYIVRAMGEQQARRYVLTGERLSAREAHIRQPRARMRTRRGTGRARGKIRRAAAKAGTRRSRARRSCSAWSATQPFRRSCRDGRRVRRGA
jgi:hypothetical protein